MKLSEIVKELTRKQAGGVKLYTQTTLAEALGTNQSAISQMLAGRVWDDHWEIFFKLLPIAQRHGLLVNPSHEAATNLQSLTVPEVFESVLRHHKAVDKNAKARTKGAQTGIVSPLSSRRDQNRAKKS